MVGSRPLALAPIAMFTAAGFVGAVALARRRDLGASALRANDVAPPRTALLSSSDGLALRLTRGVGISWIGGLAVMGLVFGLVAESAARAVSGSNTIAEKMQRIGGRSARAAAYLALAFLSASALVAFAAASQVGATRNEEASGRLDALLVRPVSRHRWLLGRVGVTLVIVVLAAGAAGVTSWIGAATQHTGLAFVDLLEAGLNAVPPAVFVLGVAIAVFGVAPRRAPMVGYAIVTWSFIVELVAALVTTNRLVLDLSLFHHVAPAPAAPVNWSSAVWLLGLGLGGIAFGTAAFRRRDLVSQ
jgi:ABC-2 type transport system permease protein